MAGGSLEVKLPTVWIDEKQSWSRRIENRRAEEKSFGGIPNSRNVLFLQIFQKRAAKPSAGNTSAGFPSIKWPQTLLNLTSLCTKAPQTFSGTFSGTSLNLTRRLHQSLPDLLRNLLRNPVEPDLALHQSFPDLLRNLQNLLRNLVEPDPAPAPVQTGAILG